MLSKSVKVLLGLAATLVCLTAMTGSVRPTQLEQIKLDGAITFVTRNSPTTYYEDRSGPTGYEYQLAQAFADYLGVELKVKVADNLEEIFASLENDEASIAAAGLTATEERKKWFRFSTPYLEVSEQVAYRRGTWKPRDADDMLGGMMVVSAGSSHAQSLRDLQARHLPELSWSESDEYDVTDLLQMVENGDISYTVVDSNEFNMVQAYFPNVGLGMSLREKQPLAWAFAHSRDNSLYQAVEAFFASSQTRAALANLNERYYGHLAKLDYVGAKRFLRQTDRKLDGYRPYFVDAAGKHGFDWRLLAAVGYQESHWKPDATSYTGVRGIMMLTMDTASDLGVTDRLNPEQSILGGSEYLASMRERLGDQVMEPDRTWMALAAYNVGLGHLRDARKLTHEMGGDPNLWKDVKEALPLLSQKRYHRNTRYGYARGHEAVDYVQNIRRYYDVLVWKDEQQQLEEDMQLSSLIVVPPLL